MADGTLTLTRPITRPIETAPFARAGFSLAGFRQMQYAVSGEEAKSIVRQAITDSQLQGDTKWLRDKSVQAYLIFAARVLGHAKRNSDDISVLTHYIQVAHRMANTPQLVEFNRSYVAFVGAAHDGVEDMAKFGVRLSDILKRWHGEPGLVTHIGRDIRDLTDPAELTGFPRLKEQLRRARNMSRVASYARLFDKITNYGSDVKGVEAGRITFNQASKAVRFLDRMDFKAKIVEALDVSILYKAEMSSIMKSLHKSVHSHLRDHISFAEMLKHAGNALVRRIAVERVMIFGQQGPKAQPEYRPS